MGVDVISIHALHEESDTGQYYFNLTKTISIHALHEESDTNHLREALDDDISIHALHEESDRPRAVNGNDTANFNPRSP